MEGPLLAWWLLLCTAAFVNPVLWFISARRLERTDPPASRRWILWLAAVYVAGCGFRSLLPMVDVPRICLHDTWVSRVVVGRSVATAAELAFVAQWALLLREAGLAGEHSLATRVSRLLVPLIVIAELCSWSAVLTTNNLLHASENSLWTVAAVLAIAGVVSIRPSLDDKGRRFATAAIICGAVYVAFMTTIDIPMYLSRWQADLAAGRVYLSSSEGMHQIVQRCIVTRDWSSWRDDVAWISLYFTAAVWISIALAHVPPLRSPGHYHGSG